ncbi:MAG: hypothetical protein WC979_03165 [Candidatus Pacearchaeota archaeon]|jgi:hypothetical protein|nr:hypothetical protein [Clostridia bacterium]
MMTKDLLLDMAKESGKNRFRLLAGMNETQWIFNWCDAEYNYIGMCTSDMDKFKIDYSLDELPDIIDNALSWLERAKAINNGTYALTLTNLYIMAI